MKDFLTPTKAVFTAFFLSLAFWAFRFHGRLPAVTDIFLFSYPCYSVNLQEWVRGFVPLWDAATGCGTPHLANSVSAAGYPLFWLWGLTGLSHWLVWMGLFHMGFAFGGFYFWARTQKISSLWAVLCALSFAGSLHMVRCWGYPVFAAAQSWTPWVFWAARQWLERGQVRWWFFLILSVGVQILAGYPFFSFYTLVFLLIWFFFQNAPPGRKAVFLTAIPAALGLSAVHWIPFVDTLGYSTRGGWGVPENFPFFIKPVEYLTLFDPAALGNPGNPTYQGQTANAAFMLYFGLIPLAAWVLGIFRRFESRRFWGLSGLFWLLWLMGFRFPLWWIVPEAWLELLDPSKAVGIFLFASCTCSGLTLSHLFRRVEEGKTKTFFLWVITLLWLVDMLLVPFRTVHLVPDSYQKSFLNQWVERVRDAAQGGRVLGFKVKGEAPSYSGGGEEEALGKAADDWVAGLLSNSPAVWGLRGSQAYLSTWTTGMDQFWKAFNRMETYQGALPDVVGIRVLYLPVTLSPPHYKDLGMEREGHLLENNFCWGDAWPAYGHRNFPNQEAILLKLTAHVPAAQNRDEVLLEEGVELPPTRRNLDVLPGDPTKGFQRTGGSRAFYQGNFSKSGWLAWNETFTPGWRAWVDGYPAPIQRAYGFFMGVPVEAGDHRVDFRYEPVSFRLGLFLTLVFLGLGLASVGRFLSQFPSMPMDEKEVL